MKVVTDDPAVLRALVDDAERVLAGGGDRDAVISALKDKGLSPIETTRVLCHALDIRLVEARRLVHFSTAWRRAFE